MKTSEYAELFYFEATKNQIEINKLFNILEKDFRNMDLVNSLFIKFHVLKGYSLGMGFKAVESMSHVLEEVFREIKDGELVFNDILLREVKSAINTLGKLIEALISGEKVTYLVCKTRLGGFLGEFKSN